MIKTQTFLFWQSDSFALDQESLEIPESCSESCGNEDEDDQETSINYEDDDPDNEESGGSDVSSLKLLFSQLDVLKNPAHYT